jgi:DNA polymerase-3 subunit gamma/tau
VALDEPPAPALAEEPQNLQHEPPDPQIRGHVSPEAERIAADLEEEIASDGEPEPPAIGEYVGILDTARDAVSQALHDKGHETASALLRAGQWALSDGNTITVSVAVKKTMLSLTMNPEAERIARTALQQAGSSAKLVVLPGDGSASPAPPAPRAAKGSIQSHALDNPLVKQAQELFRAEVRSILDLRGKP